LHLAEALRQSAAPPTAAQLVPVIVTPDQPTAAPPARAADTIEIELARGYRGRIGHGVKAASLLSIR